MILSLLQTALVVAAGLGLFAIWRASRFGPAWLRLVIAAGLIGRALAGQALFWISWAELPFAESLQLGDGLWFFGSDALLYFPTAAAAADQGAGAIVSIARSAPSVMYIQVLAGMVWLFGSVTSVAVLLNLFCFMGSIALLVHWARREPGAERGAAIAICALSLSPSLMLWSLQPLKDSFFQFLVIAFVAAAAAWQRSWRANAAWHRHAGIGTLLVILLFALAAIRWYFAFAVLGATGLFLLLTVLRVKGRRVAALASSAGLVFLLSRSLVAGAGPYLPEAILAVLNPGATVTAVREVPEVLFGGARTARSSFERSGGDTSIRPGRVADSMAVPAAPTPQPSTVAAAPAAAPTTPPVVAPGVLSPGTAAPSEVPAGPRENERAIRAVLERQTDAWDRGDLDGFLSFFWKSPELVVETSTTVIRGWQNLQDACRKAEYPRGGDLAFSDVRIVEATGDAATVTARWHSASQQPRTSLLKMRKFPGEDWKIVRVREIPPRPVPAAPAAPTHMERFAAGVAAVLLPQRLGEQMGFFHIGGGRGMMWFTEIDTLIFDIVLLLAFYALITNFASSIRNPMFWLVVTITLFVGIPLLYAVSNFGTLFRLREMIYLGLLLIPMVVASTPRTPEATSNKTVVRPK